MGFARTLGFAFGVVDDETVFDAEVGLGWFAQGDRAGDTRSTVPPPHAPEPTPCESVSDVGVPRSRADVGTLFIFYFFAIGFVLCSFAGTCALMRFFFLCLVCLCCSFGFGRWVCSSMYRF